MSTAHFHPDYNGCFLWQGHGNWIPRPQHGQQIGEPGRPTSPHQVSPGDDPGTADGELMVPESTEEQNIIPDGHSGAIPVLRFNPFSTPSRNDEDNGIEGPEEEPFNVPLPLNRIDGSNISDPVRPPDTSLPPDTQLTLSPSVIPQSSPAPNVPKPLPQTPEASLQSSKNVNAPGAAAATAAEGGENELGTTMLHNVTSEAASQLDEDLEDVEDLEEEFEPPAVENIADSSFSELSGAYRAVYEQALRDALERRRSGR